jgi:hypothetical protein
MTKKIQSHAGINFIEDTNCSFKEIKMSDQRFQPFKPGLSEPHITHFPNGVISGNLSGIGNFSEIVGGDLPARSNAQRVRVRATIQGPDKQDGLFLIPTETAVGEVEYGQSVVTANGFSLPFVVKILPLDIPIRLTASLAGSGEYLGPYLWSGVTTLTADHPQIDGANFELTVIH